MKKLLNFLPIILVMSIISCQSDHVDLPDPAENSKELVLNFFEAESNNSFREQNSGLEEKASICPHEENGTITLVFTWITSDGKPYHYNGTWTLTIDDFDNLSGTARFIDDGLDQDVPFGQIEITSDDEFIARFGSDGEVIRFIRKV